MRLYDNAWPEISDLQRRWTAYLKVAVKRARAVYISQLQKVRTMEVALTNQDGGDAYPEALVSDFDEKHQFHSDLKLVLQQLPEQTQRIVYRRIFGEKTFVTISRELHIKEGTVKAIYYKAMQDIRRRIV